MSWNGTVTCRHCYKKGHNSRSCAKLTEQIKTRYDRYSSLAADYRAQLVEDAATPTLSEFRREELTRSIINAEYSVEVYRLQYLSRAGIDLATGLEVCKKAAKAVSASQRKCGYCRTSGHTRRNCKNLANDYKLFTIQTRKLRAKQEARINELGIGVGSLVVQTKMGYDKNDRWGEQRFIGLVTEINLSGIQAGQGVSHDNSVYTIICKSISQLKGETSSFRRSPMSNLSMQCIDRERWQVKIVPSHAKVVTSNLKDTPLVEAFPSTGGAKERPWHYNYASALTWLSEAREALGIPVDAYADS